MKKLLLTCSLLILSIFSISSVQANDADMRNTYAVMWTIDTNDTVQFKKTLDQQMPIMIALWQNGTLENVYIDNKKSEDTVHKGDQGKVMFFIKAKTQKEAKTVLDEMPLIKDKVAKYQLLPVGVLWLTQY